MFKTKAKKSLCIILSIGIICSAFSGSLSQAAKKAVLKTKKVSMKVGQKKKIMIKNRKKKAVYRFAPSSKKASVSKSGVITAKKVGKVKITVTEKIKKKNRKLGKVTVQIKAKDAKNVPSVSAAPASATPVSSAPASSAPAAPTASTVPTASASSIPTPQTSEQPTQTPVSTMKPIGPYVEDTSSNVPTDYSKVIAENEGTVENITYESTVIKEGAIVERKAKVVLPKGYSADKKYPVVYMQHGIFGNETSLYGEKVQNVFWNAMANGDAEEMIAVFPNACANETGGPVGENGGFNLEHYSAYNNFLNDLKECLMPYINEHYSTLTGRENTAICGFSMGGRVTLHIGFTLQDTFRYVGAFCPAPGIFSHNDNNVNETGLFTPETFKLQEPYMNDTLVMIVKGKSDSVVKQFPKDYHDALTANGVPHIYMELPGGHDASVYKPGLYNFLRRIFHREG